MSLSIKELNELFAELGYLKYRTFGYGHSFGVLSHFYGREAGLELREDIDSFGRKYGDLNGTDDFNT